MDRGAAERLPLDSGGDVSPDISVIRAVVVGSAAGVCFYPVRDKIRPRCELLQIGRELYSIAVDVCGPPLRNTSPLNAFVVR